MKPFKLQIAAPDGLRYDGDACQLSVRGIAGELAVLLLPGSLLYYAITRRGLQNRLF